MPILLVLSVAAFVSAFSIRMIDPLVPAIARDFGISIETTAMLASAFTFTYALCQPALGPLGDATGKARIIKICLALLTLSLLVGASATSFEILFAARMLGGAAGGGIIPVGFAIIGDRFDGPDRQVALARLVMSSQIAILFGSAIGGVVATSFGWRHMFLWPAIATGAAFVLTLFALPARKNAVRQPMSLARSKAGYVESLSGPFALVCLAGVFLEGIAMSGLTPFLAGRLEQRGLGGLREAGIVIAAMALGGITFTLVVRRLLTWLGRGGLVRAGGVLVMISLVAVAYSPHWIAEGAALFTTGFGFFMIHNSLQALGTELAPNARGSGVAMFAFIFFLGQAFGPVVYGAMFTAFGLSLPILIGAATLFAVALVVAAKLDAADHPRTA